MSSIRFPWIFSTLWLMILILMIWAGFWQLGRAKEKQQINERMAVGLTHQPVTLSDWNQLKPFEAVEINGTYSSLHLLQDNQIQDGKVGYFVYSAFRTEQGLWLWINRGWHAKESEEFNVSDEAIAVKGMVGDWPRPGVQLGEQNIADVDIQHVTYLPQEAVFQALKTRLCQQAVDNECIMLPVVLKLDSEEKHGYVRDWQLPRMTAEKHQAYAAQWFTMSLVLCLVYVIFLRKHYVG
jgi:surfeit locus 1 family protein